MAVFRGWLPLGVVVWNLCAASAAWAATANVTVGSNFFTPSMLTINVNDTVLWTWTGNNRTNIAAGTRVLHTVATDNRGATNTSATVTVSVVAPVPIVLSGMQRSFDTQSVFFYSANVGLRYEVQRAARLSNWTAIVANTATTNLITVTDSAPTNRMNFYRVRRLPNP